MWAAGGNLSAGPRGGADRLRPRRLGGGGACDSGGETPAPYLLKLKSAVCSVPSFSLTTSSRQVFFHAALVFQLKW